VSEELAQAALHRDRSLAAPFVGGLWAGIRSVDGPRPARQDYQHLPGVFDPAWLQTLPLPIGENRPTRQTVSLGRGTQLERFSDEAAVRRAYAREQRTRIYEGVESRSGGWMAEATRYLMKLAGCDVVCTVYESRAGDKTFGPHADGWYGVIVQMYGAKAWQLGEDAGRKDATVVVEAGDLLIVPEGLLHDVSTPDYSVHVTVAMLVNGYDWMKPEIEAGRIVPVELG
jgi:hypothetical protein